MLFKLVTGNLPTYIAEQGPRGLGHIHRPGSRRDVRPAKVLSEMFVSHCIEICQDQLKSYQLCLYTIT